MRTSALRAACVVASAVIILAGCSAEPDADYIPPGGGGVSPTGDVTEPAADPADAPTTAAPAPSASPTETPAPDSSPVPTSTLPPSLWQEQHPVADGSSREWLVNGSAANVTVKVLTAMLEASHTDPSPKSRIPAVRPHVTDRMWTYLGGDSAGTISPGQKRAWEDFRANKLTTTVRIDSATRSGMGVAEGEHAIEVSYQTRTENPDGIGRTGETKFATAFMVPSGDTFLVDRIEFN